MSENAKEAQSGEQDDNTWEDVARDCLEMCTVVSVCGFSVYLFNDKNSHAATR